MTDPEPIDREAEDEQSTAPGKPASTAGNRAEDESTVGVGTGLALGCIALTVVVILLGLLFLLFVRVVG